MPFMLNAILREANIPLGDVRLLRHKDKRAAKGRTPYELWRDNREQFDWYQATQGISHRKSLNAPYWASFVGTPNGETLFVGLYCVRYRGLLDRDTPMPHMDGMDLAGTRDVYHLAPDHSLDGLIARLLIDWGPGTRAWIQRADRKNKRVIELRKAFKEPDFPGFLNFISPLSKIESLPAGWASALRSSKGVYLLTCPRTREQYVGAAYGANGFWGRLQEYAQTGHGGDVALKSRDPSDYQVSIIEVAGSALEDDDILRMEARWKSKLQSREMGLNRN